MSDINFSFGPSPLVLTSQMFSLVVIAFWIITTIVHIALAVGVYLDTGLLWRHERRKTIFVGGALWGLAALVGGPFVAAIYWLIHHSSLRPQPATQSPSEGH